LIGAKRKWRCEAVEAAFDPERTYAACSYAFRNNVVRHQRILRNQVLAHNAVNTGVIMRRRILILLLSGTVAGWPFMAPAQHPTKLPTIGFLGAATPAVASQWVSAFVKRLAELGWIEGRTVSIEYRWADARPERYAEIATEFISLKVNVIVTWASAPTLAVKRATGVVPVVFAAQMDPVGAGIVTSLARPGGNITGMSIQQTDTAGKRLELLREAVPDLHRLAIMGNAAAPGAVLEMNELHAAAGSLGLEATRHEIRQAEDIPPRQAFVPPHPQSRKLLAPLACRP
jgi:putative ABC transport system substrate-binding protein